jgi:hypothetical protein
MAALRWTAAAWSNRVDAGSRPASAARGRSPWAAGRRCFPVAQCRRVRAEFCGESCLSLPCVDFIQLVLERQLHRQTASRAAAHPLACPLTHSGLQHSARGTTDPVLDDDGERAFDDLCRVANATTTIVAGFRSKRYRGRRQHGCRRSGEGATHESTRCRIVVRVRSRPQPIMMERHHYSRKSACETRKAGSTNRTGSSSCGLGSPTRPSRNARSCARRLTAGSFVDGLFQMSNCFCQTCSARGSPPLG